MNISRIQPGYRPMKNRQTMLALFCLLLSLTGAGLVFLLLVSRRTAVRGRRVLSEDQRWDGPPDCVIVPGAPYEPDGRPGPMLESRLASAFELYRQRRADRILLSGDHGDDSYDELAVMRRYLLEQGVRAEDLFCDHAGFDTYQTLVRAKTVFGVRRALITTQNFHLLRALYIGEQLGISLRGVACGMPAGQSSLWQGPREILARFKAWLDCEICHTRPMIAGSPIPLSGDGQATFIRPAT